MCCRLFYAEKKQDSRKITRQFYSCSKRIKPMSFDKWHGKTNSLRHVSKFIDDINGLLKPDFLKSSCLYWKK